MLHTRMHKYIEFVILCKGLCKTIYAFTLIIIIMKKKQNSTKIYGSSDKKYTFSLMQIYGSLSRFFRVDL